MSVNPNCPINWSITPTEALNTFPFGTPNGWQKAGIEPSGAAVAIASNALGETINGLYKAELIHRRAPWKSKESVELATLQWVHWFNHIRLLGSIGHIPPFDIDPATLTPEGLLSDDGLDPLALG